MAAKKEHSHKPSFYSVTPATVRYDSSLAFGARLLYGEITALCNHKGYCWAGDRYFAELYSVSESTIQRYVSSLIEKGYLTRVLITRTGSKEIEERRLYVSDAKVSEVGSNLNPGVGSNLTKGGVKFDQDNTLISNTLIETPAISKRKTKIQIPDDFKVEQETIEWIKEKWPSITDAEITEETEAFMDHFLTRTERYVHWQLTFRNWIRKAVNWGNIGPLKKTGSNGVTQRVVHNGFSECPICRDLGKSNCKVHKNKE